MKKIPAFAGMILVLDCKIKNPATWTGFSNLIAQHLLVEEAKLLLEAGHAATAVEDGCLAACPCRVGFGIDIEAQGCTGLVIGGAGDKFAAIGHDNGDGVIVWMDTGFHDSYSANDQPSKKEDRGMNLNLAGLYRMATSGARASTEAFD